MSDLTLNEKLELIQQARDDIQTALEDKGQVVGKDIRDYAEAVTNITTSEDLTAELTAQTQKLEELEAILENKTQGAIKPLIYCQETEPINKIGIWLQTDKIAEHYIADDNIYNKETWATSDKTQNLPYSFNQGSAVILDDNIYILGGSNSKRSNYKYNISTKTYTQLANIPYDFSSGTATVNGTDIYLIGGDSYAYNNYRYDTLTDTYTDNTALPFNFYCGCAEIIGDTIYLLGGGSNRNLTYKYDITTDTYTQLANIPYEFYIGATTIIDTVIYLFGSYSYNYCYKYDTVTNTYTKLNDMPYRSCKCGIANNGEDIYLFGGESNTTYCYKYNILNNNYTKLSDMSYSYNGGTSASNGKDVYLLGGYNSNIQYNNKLYYIEGKSYNTDNSVVIKTGNTYNVELYNTTFEDGYKPNCDIDFDDVYYYTEQDGLDDTISTYYGDGTQWINFKNPPVEEVED